MLLFAYGFALPNNKYDAFAVKLVHRKTNADKKDRSLANISTMNTFYIYKGGFEGVPEELWRDLANFHDTTTPDNVSEVLVPDHITSSNASVNSTLSSHATHLIDSDNLLTSNKSKKRKHKDNHVGNSNNISTGNGNGYRSSNQVDGPTGNKF